MSLEAWLRMMGWLGNEWIKCKRASNWKGAGAWRRQEMGLVGSKKRKFWMLRPHLLASWTAHFLATSCSDILEFLNSAAEIQG